MPLRKVSRYQEDFINIIFQMADKLNLRNIEYVTQFGSEDIDNFSSGIFKVKIKGYRDGHKITQSVIIKWHPDPKMRISLRELYQREFVFYQNVVPALLEIQRRFKIIEGLKIKFPNCIYANAEHDKETIVQLGLSEYGFEMLDRFQKTDLNHASLVLKNLAKLHALSFVLAKSDGKEFEEIKKLYCRDVQYSDPNCVSNSMEFYYNASVDVVSDSAAKEKLKRLAPDILLVLNKCTMPVPFSVICHADCWNNNIFFKYQKTRPVDVIFIDYQLSRYASPVTDISYYMYMSTERELLMQHYDRLLNIYYGTLTAVLRQCNLDVEDVYPKTIFHKHLKEYSVFGLIEALVSMKIITADSKEALKMTEMKYCCTEEGFCENFASQNQSLFVERVNGVVNDFFKRDYTLSAVLN